MLDLQQASSSGPLKVNFPINRPARNGNWRPVLIAVRPVLIGGGFHEAYVFASEYDQLRALGLADNNGRRPVPRTDVMRAAHSWS